MEVILLMRNMSKIYASDLPVIALLTTTSFSSIVLFFALFGFAIILATTEAPIFQ